MIPRLGYPRGQGFVAGFGLAEVMGGNSYPRPGSVTVTWSENGGFDVLSWIVGAVGGSLEDSEELIEAILDIQVDASSPPPAPIEGGSQWAGAKSEGAGSVIRRGIVSALCSCIPRTATDADRLVAEVPGAERLNRESAAVKAVGAHTLQPASVEELVDNIEDRNPSLVHIAGHNQYLEGEPRIVGFSEGDDGPGLTELVPGRLAQLVVDAAALNTVCALVCVMINACNSLKFATALLAHAKNSARFQHKLRVICWPGLTDDIMCSQFAKGFFKRFKRCQDQARDQDLLTLVKAVPDLSRKLETVTVFVASAVHTLAR